jgi:uncharacterized protein YcbK (DUF882 family)
MATEQVSCQMPVRDDSHPFRRARRVEETLVSFALRLSSEHTRNRCGSPDVMSEPGDAPMTGNATMHVSTEAPSRSAMTRRGFLTAATSFALLTAGHRSVLAAPRGERRLALYNPHTDERFDDVYWSDGSYVAPSLTRIDWLMRDYHRDAVAVIDPELIDLLHRIAHRLETSEPFHLLSGYRTAATNRLLRHEGLSVAVHSEHLKGKAADINIDGISLMHLRRAAVALQAGGVGVYPRDRFVHVDVGPVRVWG